MGKANERKRQKRREKQKRKRDQAKRAAQQAKPLEARSFRSLVALGSAGEFGPAWISSSYDDPERPYALIAVMCTRRVPGGLLLGVVALVDRTCLGIKNAYVVGPVAEHEMAGHVDRLGRFDPMLRCEPLVAQSVVFHALDYARSLGFEPHRDFESALFEPRPATLVATPFARPKRPLYAPGPNDRSDAIRRKLDAAVGSGNYDFLTFDMDGFEPFEDSLEPADRGEVPGRIDWRRACVDVPFWLPFEDLELDHDPSLEQAVEAIELWLERGYYFGWEAVIRLEQGLELSPRHTNRLAELGVREGDLVHWIDDWERPGEPWYQSVRELAPRLLVDRLVTHEPTGVDRRLLLGAQMLDAIEAHAGPLSLPHGCAAIQEILPKQLWHRLRIQPLYLWLLGLGTHTPEGRLVSLADSEEGYRIEEIADAVVRCAPSLAALGWGTGELMEPVVMPVADRRTLLEALAARAP